MGMRVVIYKGDVLLLLDEPTYCFGLSPEGARRFALAILDAVNELKRPSDPSVSPEIEA